MCYLVKYCCISLPSSAVILPVAPSYLQFLVTDVADVDSVSKSGQTNGGIILKLKDFRLVHLNISPTTLCQEVMESIIKLSLPGALVLPWMSLPCVHGAAQVLTGWPSIVMQYVNKCGNLRIGAVTLSWSLSCVSQSVLEAPFQLYLLARSDLTNINYRLQLPGRL